MLTIQVDSRNALAKLDKRTGLPEEVRKNLRALIPDLTRRLGALVENNLNTGLKTRRRLQVKKEMVENPRELYGRVRTISTSEPFLLPLWLEEGTKAHVIEARNAKVLAFYWEKLGGMAYYKRVNHPGFAGLHYMANAFSAMEAEITRTIGEAVHVAALQMEDRKGRF